MLPVNSPTPTSSTLISGVSLDSSNPEDHNIWFDAIDHVEMEETWFDTREEPQAAPSSSAGEAADSQVPFTEDCRRGVQQFIRTLGEYGESRMLSACLSKILPGTPASLVIAANSLYTAVTERRDLDTAALHALGLASMYLPDNINVVSRLAAFIRDTVTGWTDETFLQQFLGNKENHTSIHLFTALAVTAIVAGRWMKDEGAPQRGVLKVPAFMANIFIRASHYWTALGNMAGRLPSGAEITKNTGTSQHVPAFKVDTRMEMIRDVCDAAVPCSPSAPRLTGFSSNSTASPDAYTRATVQNRPARASWANPSHSGPERAHYLAVDKLRQESGLSDLLYCVTSKTEARQEANDRVVTALHFNTKCDATDYPEALSKEVDSLPVHTDIPETGVTSQATGRSGGDALLPLVMAGATAAPVTMSYMQALKSKTGIAAGAVVSLTGLAVGGKFLWNKLATHNTEGKNVNRAVDIEPPEAITSKSLLHRENHRVKNLLLSEGILKRKGNVSKEKLLYLVSNYVINGNNNDASEEKNIKKLARKILSASNTYGGGENEEISIEQEKYVVRNWVFQNIIGTSPEKHIEIQMKLDISRNYNVDDIHHLLPVDTLPSGYGFHSEKLSSFEKHSLLKMWKSFLMEEMPFLNFSENQVKMMSLKDYNFANLYSGSRFLTNAGVKKFTFGEAISTGQSMWDLAVSEGISEDKLGFYLTPALLFNIPNLSEGIKKEQVSDLELVNKYLQYRQEISEVQKDIHEKYNKYLSATSAWLRKGKLADYIISQCSVLHPGLPDLADGIRTPEQNRKKAESDAKQDYLNGMRKPCKNAPESLNHEYDKLTVNVADSFREIDKYLIISAISALPDDDKTFIQSPDASIYPANAYIQMRQPGSAFVGKKHFIERTDLFAVKRGGEERVYALKAENNNNGYKIARLDHDIKQYISSGVLGEGFDSYEINWDKIEDSQDINSFEVIINEPALIGNGSHIDIITDSLSEKHRGRLYNELHEAGNDKSDLQNIWNIIKHLIPFYDCVEGVVNNNLEQAIPLCLLDAVSFIPAFGKAANLSGKFGMGLAKGLRSSARVVVKKGIQAANKDLLREVSLPTTRELASLGKDVLGAADPGFALTGSISSKFGNKIIRKLSADKETAVLASKIASSSQTGKFLQPSLVSPVMVTLPGTRVQVPAIKLGMKDGRDTYVRINTETGEKFGEYFFRDVKGEMLEIKTPKKTEMAIDSPGVLGTTSGHVSKELNKMIQPEMFSEKVDAGKLSAPDHQGLRYDADGNKYIKVKSKYIKLEQIKDLPFIRMDNGDKIYVSYVGNEFKPIKVKRHNGLVSSSPNEVFKDSRINALSGLDVREVRPLNQAWSLKGITIKNKNFDKNNAIGSSIDVTFTMEYNKLKNNRYIEMPPLQWKESIDFKEGDSKWHFQADMYEHNPKSMTFFPWRNRYVEAYNFVKAKDKNLFNGNVRIYKKNMESVGINDIKSASTSIEKVKSIQDFLSRKGGVIEITITDVPQIIKREAAKNKERKLIFDIGFNDKVEAHFSQGILLDTNGEANVFVTTSDSIKLARGNVNVQPPEIVTKPRKHQLSLGEVY